jgi:hypothetical protein
MTRFQQIPKIPKTRTIRRRFSGLIGGTVFGILLFATAIQSQTVSAKQKENNMIQPEKAISKSVTEDPTIRPFQVKIPKTSLINLRKRIAETQWAEKETVKVYSRSVFGFGR